MTINSILLVLLACLTRVLESADGSQQNNKTDRGEYYLSPAIRRSLLKSGHLRDTHIIRKNKRTEKKRVEITETERKNTDASLRAYSSSKRWKNYDFEQDSLGKALRMDRSTKLSIISYTNNAKKNGATFILLTAGTWAYRGAVFNWIKHTEARGIKHYLVLCFDEKLFRYVGSERGVLVRNTAGFTYSDDSRQSSDSSTEDSQESEDQSDTEIITPSSAHLQRRHLRHKELAFGSVRPFPSIVPTSQPSSLQHGQERDREEKRSLSSSTVKSLSRSLPESSSKTKKELLKKTATTQKTNDEEPPEEIVKGVAASRLNEFHIMMVTKYEAIEGLLKLGFPVIWSDTDSLLLSSCAIDFLLNASPHADIVAQRGLSPYRVSSLIGSALCTGYFIIRPTHNGKKFINAVRTDLMRALVAKSGRRGDQAVVNFLLLRWRALLFGDDGTGDRVRHTTTTSREKNLSTSSSMSIVSTLLKIKDIFGRNLGNATRHSTTRSRMQFKPSTNYLTNNTIDYSSSPHARVTVALLPYYQFPRGIPPLARTSLWYAPTDDAQTRSSALINSSEKAQNPGLYGVSTEQKLSRLYQSMSVFQNKNGSSKSLSLRSEEFGLDKVAEKLLHQEWQLLAPTACIWHRISAKEGGSKVAAMARDGVLLLPESWLDRTAELSVEEVQQRIYN